MADTAQAHALATLERYRPGLRHYLARWGADVEEADDVIGDLALRFARRPPQLNTDCSPWRFLRVACRRALQRRRESTPRVASLDVRTRDGEGELADTVGELLADEAPGPEARAVAADVARVVGKALAAGPAADQVVVTELLGGGTLATAAGALGVSRG